MEQTSFIKIGYGNLVAAHRIVAVVSPESSPVKRLIQESRDRGTLIDASSGRKTRSVLVMDSDHLVLSAMPADDIANELGVGGQGADP